VLSCQGPDDATEQGDEADKAWRWRAWCRSLAAYPQCWAGVRHWRALMILTFLMGAAVGAVLAFVLPRVWNLPDARRRKHGRGREEGGTGALRGSGAPGGEEPAESAVASTRASSSTDAFQRMESVEEIAYRCEACGQPFAVLYSRSRNPERSGDTTIAGASIRCPRPSCRHTNLVFLPINCRGVVVREWQGADDVVPHPTAGEVVAAASHSRADPKAPSNH
jgi:DNA-directed RNA polymerase subunit RPC12/RpoP